MPDGFYVFRDWRFLSPPFNDGPACAVCGYSWHGSSCVPGRRLGNEFHA